MDLEDLARSTIRSIIQRREESGDSSFKSKPRSGRPKKTTPRDNRALLRAANHDTKATLYALATPSKSSRQLSRGTVRKILKAAGKAKRRPRKKPFLKPEHKYW
jgi:transposase